MADIERRNFLGGAVAGALSGGLAAMPLSAQTAAPAPSAELVVERAAEGTPHRGKTLALITPHLDDGPIFAGGAIAKLLREGYTGYFIRTSNDEKDSFSSTLGETVLANERDVAAFVRSIGMVRHFDLSYRNHRMDDVSRVEIRGRLIFLFRLLKVDTVFSYDPWGHYEENPDHYVTAQASRRPAGWPADSWTFPNTSPPGSSRTRFGEVLLRPRAATGQSRGRYRPGDRRPEVAAIRSCQTMITHMVQGFERVARRAKAPDPGAVGTGGGGQRRVHPRRL